MTTFPVHSGETAPEGSKPILAAAQKKLGFVPNLFRVFAEAPAIAEAYGTVMDIFERSSLSDAEKQTVLLSASHANGCGYCMAAHSTIAQMKGVAPEIVEALRGGTTLSDAKLDALAALTRSIVETRGWPSDEVKAAFFGAGYGTAEYLEVILGIAVKTISNYVNHAADTPLDPAFEAAKWPRLEESVQGSRKTLLALE
ncbi:MAG: carboxymuconolactone decarboxylase family protein [Alphaproteobacteria bacterium]|nr:carboxymuconolactone decarboxylase family protein [Alphaproteobacteria bacterium]MCZ6742002.1 carboxymuconolactone decarboxylase family protein [Alphaproteobacteria bacterium]